MTLFNLVLVIVDALAIVGCLWLGWLARDANARHLVTLGELRKSYENARRLENELAAAYERAAYERAREAENRIPRDILRTAMDEMHAQLRQMSSRAWNPTLDSQTADLIRLATSNPNENERHAAAMIVCKRLREKIDK